MDSSDCSRNLGAGRGSILALWRETMGWETVAVCTGKLILASTGVCWCFNVCSSHWGVATDKANVTWCERHPRLYSEVVEPRKSGIGLNMIQETSGRRNGILILLAGGHIPHLQISEFQFFDISGRAHQLSFLRVLPGYCSARDTFIIGKLDNLCAVCGVAETTNQLLGGLCSIFLQNKGFFFIYWFYCCITGISH